MQTDFALGPRPPQVEAIQPLRPGVGRRRAGDPSSSPNLTCETGSGARAPISLHALPSAKFRSISTPHQSRLKPHEPLLRTQRPDTRPTSRRQFLRHAGGGFGMLALASLLNRDGLLAATANCRRRHSAQSARAEVAAFPGEGAARDFSLHVRRAEPCGFVRSEAGPDSSRGPADSGIVRHLQDAPRRGEEQAARAAAAPSNRTASPGIEVSDFLPHIAECVDDICLLARLPRRQRHASRNRFIR